MSKTVGIDLGTSRCCVAAVVDGEPKVLLRSSGASFTPTVLSLTQRGLRVGSAAEELALSEPESTVFGIPRWLGRKYHSSETDWLRACSPNNIVAGANGDVALELAGKEYTPTELVSFVLEDLRRLAERELGEEVTDAVIAVPAAFDELQRRATMDAATLAGLGEARLVNATSAAALAYAQGITENLRVAIIDFGAANFAVTIADVREEAVEILAIASDPLLGGDDVDKRLVLHLLDEHLAHNGADLSLEPTALAQLTRAARQIKHTLSRHTKSEPLELGAIRMSDGREEAVTVPAVSRRKLVEIIAHELAGMKDPCRWAFDDCELGTDDLEAVVLIGGMAHMPATTSAMKYLFRALPTTPEEAPRLVVEGAARLAAARRGEHPRLRLRDITPHSIGIKLRAGRFEPVISRNHRIPCVDTKMFKSAGSGQDLITFELFQGESELSTENTYVGRLMVSGMTPGAQFGVAFQLDSSGTMQASMVDPEAGEKKDVPLQLAGGLSRDELAALASARAARSRPDKKQPTETPVPNIPSSALRARRTGIGANLDEAPSRRFERPRGLATSAGRRAGSSRTTDISATDASSLDGAPPRVRAIEVSADSLVGTILEGRYEIQKVVADGGMGRVYLARHALLGRPFAIKVLHPELANNRDIADRFLREARAASSIQSNHVVDISDFGSLSDGTSYFVMEYLEGKTLEAVLDERGPLPAGMVRSIGIQVADGLRGAHEQNVVHRDLKPSNIVLVERPEHPHFCKILDFGIAKSPTSSSSGNTLVTMVGVMMGTPHYMAPEQIDGIKVDGRSDVYALGIVMYEMVTGLPPFDAESVAQLLAQQKWTPPPPIHETYEQADCPPELAAVILRCLEKDPDDRYQTAQELGTALAGG